ncbi:unnamed protein product [marine sediment metagenome]|uniref:Uncharacterized protein n=1 Tax=marine sediment metagenome TaxID=412755 RepID=X1IVG4_9ZZZZ
MLGRKNREAEMRVCIVGAGDGGGMAASQIRRLDGEGKEEGQ